MTNHADPWPIRHKHGAQRDAYEATEGVFVYASEISCTGCDWSVIGLGRHSTDALDEAHARYDEHVEAADHGEEPDDD